MNRIGALRKSIPLVALFLSAGGGIPVMATLVTSVSPGNISVSSEVSLSQDREKLQLAQRVARECRQVTQSTFIYPQRSNIEPVRALQVDERVTLAEENGKGGWIAISSPISGFVQIDYLKRCGVSSGSLNTPPRNVSTSNRCRRVSYTAPEGLTIRERPDQNSRRVGGVFYDEQVTLSYPPEFKTDNDGREWARLALPTPGWVSNGYPRGGDLNLEACR
ncbi:SH3 domain-containing protein [Limnofasciculus baicalensis]|uniref:SH3 domain-containing protein n=1 Tax=Limnofasciculus baicalensis BBK-W-15 TaxID=2699891 RepID=A0AAE3KNM0_9CYAN|nr:SH3 domain-containing protein [Limnofasciculus baicalensis]MCP2730665.1 SH3 domain-containing protein [Limnofasciculus baicalensis BBK-W-15]